jgi:two-component sensor histidine kinase
MPRAWIWLQLLLGWLPVGALFALMLFIAHGGSPLTAIVMALQLVLTAAALGLVVYRLTLRIPWPHPLRLRFVGVQLLAALAYAVVWTVANVLIASVIATVLHSQDQHRLVLVFTVGPSWGLSYLLAGFWLYVMVAGVAYANRAAERAAQTEALAARTQLAALRAQLHPHLLFNALHTVVQLIPEDPQRAARAAEQLAAILRVALAEQRDVVTLAEEWAFVQRYLAIESLRFGERLRVQADIAPDALDALTPAFALQTLVENAIRHAAAPRVEPTAIRIGASRDDDLLALSVHDDGAGAQPPRVDASAGTGLRRLRERLSWLCGTAARLEITTAPGAGFEARLLLPQAALRTAAAARDADD